MKTLTLTDQELTILRKALETTVDIHEDTVTDSMFVTPSDGLLDRNLLLIMRKEVNTSIALLKEELRLQARLNFLTVS